MFNWRFGLLAAALAMTAAYGSALAATTHLIETGSTLLYPLMNEWATSYRAGAKDVEIETAATGSGAGVREAAAGRAQIGASDVFLTDKIMKLVPLLNIPLVVSGQQINYNVPEIGAAPLNLSGPLLAEIYSGTVVFWDDRKIAAINAGLAAQLPHRKIVAIHRSDSSGDTSLFTHFLGATTPGWATNPGAGSHIVWPANAKSLSAEFNRGMVETCKLTPYSIAYVGITYLRQTSALGLGHAALENQAGKFVLPAPAGLRAAVAALGKVPPDERLSLIDEPGDGSYPIVNFEYAIVNAHQPDPATAAALRDFLTWIVSPDGGSDPATLEALDLIPLPRGVAARSRAQIASIQ